MAARAILACTALGTIIMGLVGVLFIFGGVWLTRVVSTQEVHLENTPSLLLICGVMQVFFAITMVLRQGLFSERAVPSDSLKVLYAIHRLPE